MQSAASASPPPIGRRRPPRPNWPRRLNMNAQGPAPPPPPAARAAPRARPAPLRQPRSVPLLSAPPLPLRSAPSRVLRKIPRRSWRRAEPGAGQCCRFVPVRRGFPPPSLSFCKEPPSLAARNSRGK
ncbi:uncharacterized protein LOC135449100 [Zonotrichia leucophrys gambelii]|uniref:uncharacterized protein LOC135449100 n=1 Tax=Zonotrichia leucophrys gambelii TaxID=257770 RepID=UPI0031402081